MASIAERELTWMGAGELARLIRDKQVSAAEAVEARLARIEELNPTLNSVAIPLFDRARREAAEADAAVRRGDQIGPLHAYMGPTLAGSNGTSFSERKPEPDLLVRLRLRLSRPPKSRKPLGLSAPPALRATSP